MVKDLRSLIEEAGLDLDDDDDEDDDRPLFVPLPLTTTVVNPPPYAITDPEWHEFVLLAKDEEHQEQLKGAQPGPFGRDAMLTRYSGPPGLCGWTGTTVFFTKALRRPDRAMSRFAGHPLSILPTALLRAQGVSAVSPDVW